MKRTSLLACTALLAAACVAPVAAQSAPCSLTTSTITTPTGLQIRVHSTGWQPGETVHFQAQQPGGITTSFWRTVNGDSFDVMLQWRPGSYVIGPATGTTCTAGAISLLAKAAPTHKPAARATVPPLPTITLPPTDTE